MLRLGIYFVLLAVRWLVFVSFCGPFCRYDGNDFMKILVLLLPLLLLVIGTSWVPYNNEWQI